jgi:molybdate transport system permease protein
MTSASFDWQAFGDPVLRSLHVSVIASLCVFMISILAAWWMAKVRFRGKMFVETVFMLPLVLPPTVIGFLLLIAFGRTSPLGAWIEQFFGQPLVFSWWAAVFAAMAVAFPLMYKTIAVGFASIEQPLEDAARAYGASTWQVFRYVLLPMSWRSLTAGYVLGFARCIGEFGATVMFAGNIPGKTQTLSTAIFVAADSGNMTLAWLWTLSIILISFAILTFVQKRLFL